MFCAHIAAAIIDFIVCPKIALRHKTIIGYNAMNLVKIEFFILAMLKFMLFCHTGSDQ